MAVYTKLTLEQVAQLLSDCGIARPLAITGIAAGSRHTNYRVEVADKTLFLRINEGSSPEALAYERDLVTHLVAAGFPTPSFASPCAVSFGDKPVSLFAFVRGEPIEPQRLTTENIAEVGRHLARFHVATRDFKNARENPFSAKRVRAMCDRVEHEGRPDLRVVGKRLHDEVARCADAFEGLAPATIHGDLFHDNILWSGDKITAILDFEMASTGAIPYDVAVAILALTFVDRDFRWDQARELVGAYSRVNALETIERNALYWISRFAAARFAVSRITDFEMRPAPEALDRIHKDYRDFLQRLDRLDEIGDALFLERVLE
ncbi:MAG: homoserine kinase [Deltaproteobacteria bacterium]|nr:homoserine kinase [Deltaproteobacteria bacterium]